MNLICNRQAIGSAYSLVAGDPSAELPIEAKDQEKPTEAGLTLAQSAVHYLRIKAPYITSITLLGFRFLSHELGDKIAMIKPAVAVLGVVCCTIDILVESRGIIRCTKFLNDPSSLETPSLFNQLQNTAIIQDPIKKKQERADIIRTVLKQLKPTPLTQKIESVFEEVVERESREKMPPLSLSLFQRIAQSLRSLWGQTPAVQTMTYEALEKNIEAADYFSKLHAFKATHLNLTEEQQEKIRLCAEKKYPDDLNAREAFKQRKVESKEIMRASDLSQRVGESHVKKLQSSIDPLLTDLLSEDPSIQTQALLDTKNLLENTKIQTEKLRLIHIVGLVSAVLTGISLLITLCVVCAPAIPMIIGIIGMSIYVVRYLLASELMENEGWQFSLKSSITRGFILPIKENLIDPLISRVRKIAQTLFETFASAETETLQTI